MAKPRHGHSKVGWKSPTYRSWQNMIARCYYPSNPAFEHYRKRGITVCERWLRFDNFLADMGRRPDGTTLDRINNDGDYEPGNVRWASRRTQANNRVTNRFFEFRGALRTLSEIVRETGVSKELLRARLSRSDLPWTVEGAVSTPPLPKNLAKSGFYC